ASMNIEHAYFDRAGEYKPFPGICLVDTFDMRAQSTFFTEANTTRIEAQSRQEIFVVIGNPPYNAWQVNENDNNKNRKYEALNERISETYAKSSRATNKSALSDPYVKAIRWASDRIKQEGVVAFVTKSGIREALAADGMRMHLSRDFDEVYIVKLGGNVRKNPKLSRTTLHEENYLRTSSDFPLSTISRFANGRTEEGIRRNWTRSSMQMICTLNGAVA